MALFFTPGQFARHSDLFRRLSQLTAAGVPVTSALQQLERHPPGRAYKAPITKTIEGIEQGQTFTEAARSAGDWLPEFDVALLESGEISGRLEACLAMLADHYEQRARIARELLMALMYPVFLLHAAVFILAFPQLFLTGDWISYFATTGKVLVPIYVIIGLGIYLAQSRHGQGWRAFLERVTDCIPVLGSARRELALSRLAMALEALLSAGVTIIEAWQLAATSSGSQALRKNVQAWLPELNAGKTPAEMVQNSRRFPEVFSSQYATGEITGKLDETLRRLHAYYQEAGLRKLHGLAQWTPWIVYLGVAAYIAYRVLQFWAGYFQQINQVF